MSADTKKIAADCGMSDLDARMLARALSENDYQETPIETRLCEIIGALYRRIELLDPPDHALPQRVVVITDSFHYGVGQDLEGAIHQAHEAGARGSRECIIYIYRGPEDSLKEITVDNGAGIHRNPTTTTSNRVGKVKLTIRKEPTK